MEKYAKYFKTDDFDAMRRELNELIVQYRRLMKGKIEFNDPEL